MEYNALLGLQSAGGNRFDALKETLGLIKGVADLEQLSSVYQVLALEDKLGTTFVSPDKDPNAASLCVAVSLKTNKECTELSHSLKKALKNQNVKWAGAELLLFENFIRMVPDDPLPHPELHKMPQWIVPAAEIWGNYRHPILNETLALLRNESQYQQMCRFYCQGKSLLDFSGKEQ